MSHPLALLPVTPREWRGAVETALADGWRFAGLYAVDAGPAPALRLVWTSGERHRLVSCRAASARVPSIVDVVPAAPKSASFTRPRASNNTLPGFKSR